MKIKFLIAPIISCLMALLFTGCVDPYYSGPDYREPSYGGGYGHGGYYGGYEDRRERKELERERERLEDERERLEEERRRNEEMQRRPPPPPPVAERPRERCPSGFTPSENKCSQEERRRGCKDMRLPGGLGCVKR